MSFEPSSSPLVAADDDEALVPWTAEQAAAWRTRQPAESLWLPAGVQAMAALVLCATVLLLIGGSKPVVWSVGYGALCAVVPSWLHVAGYLRMVRASSRLGRQAMAGAGFTALVVWETVKIILTVAMLWMAPRVVADVNWLALVLAFVLVVKAHWLALVLGQRRKLRAR